MYVCFPSRLFPQNEITGSYDRIIGLEPLKFLLLLLGITGRFLRIPLTVFLKHNFWFVHNSILQDSGELQSSRETVTTVCPHYSTAVAIEDPQVWLCTFVSPVRILHFQPVMPSHSQLLKSIIKETTASHSYWMMHVPSRWPCCVYQPAHSRCIISLWDSP